MAATARVEVARSDVVGSLLRPAYLREARQGAREGRVSAAELRAVEDRTPRAGDFSPLRHVLPHHTAVLGLVTTKSPALEDAMAVEARLRQATQYVPLERLAISPQCGFASGEAGNPLTPADQEAKLRLIAQVARRVWRT